MAWGRAVALGSAVGAASCGSDGTEPPPAGTPNEPPVAAFSVDVSEGFAPLEVRFDGSASSDPDGTVTSWAWEFGDGTRGTGRVTTHVYEEPGAYTPALTVTDPRGATNRRAGDAIAVHSPPGRGDAEIGGVVWHDADADGLRGAEEDVVPRMLVFLDENGDGRRDSTEAAALTDSTGRYAFRGLDSDRSYTVTQELTLGWTNTAPGRASPRGAASAHPWATPADGGGLAASKPEQAHREAGADRATIDGGGLVASRPGQAPHGARADRLAIIGGGLAAAGEFPFQVALLSADSLRLSCGGTFVAASWVMTAAHCVDGVEPDSVVVLAGTHNLASGGELLDVVRIVVHPGYAAEPSFANDLALLQVEGRHMHPRIELLAPGAAQLAAPGTRATVVGWGYTAAGGAPSALLRKLETQIVSNDECRTQLGSHIRDTNICAGAAGAPGATCHGDSGGPLMVPFRRRWVQAGVVSFGATICNQPSAFARVSALLDFPAGTVPPERSGAVVVDWAAGTTAEVNFGNFR